MGYQLNEDGLSSTLMDLYSVLFTLFSPVGLSNLPGASPGGGWENAQIPNLGSDDYTIEIKLKVVAADQLSSILAYQRILTIYIYDRRQIDTDGRILSTKKSSFGFTTELIEFVGSYFGLDSGGERFDELSVDFGRQVKPIFAF